MDPSIIAISILHYKDALITSRCIDSLLSLQIPNGWDLKIIVVDNNSANGSFELLKAKYKTNVTKYIASKQNLGFAQGNNLGFNYAKKILNADIAIFLNNDIEILQNDFINKTIALLQDSDIDVLSPDVCAPQVYWHQSPLCDGSNIDAYIESIVEENRAKLTQKQQRSPIFIIKTMISNLLINFNWYINYLIKKQRNKNISEDWKHSRSDIVPQGACVILASNFIKNMDYVFYPETFMYFEECILKIICDAHGFKTYYSSDIQVLHHHKPITKDSMRSKSKQQEIKTAILTLDSYKILMDLKNALSTSSFGQVDQ